MSTSTGPATADGRTSSDAGSAALPAVLVVAAAAVMAPVMVLVVTVLALAGAVGTIAQCQPTANDVVGSGFPGGARIPVAGRYVVTSEFGVRTHPVTGQVRAHSGLDLATIPSGGPVVAATAGTVTSARADGDAGNVVTIAHNSIPATALAGSVGVPESAGPAFPAGPTGSPSSTEPDLTTRYLHLARWTVTPGQHVETGQQIGIEGTTGLSTGEHLHFEVRQDGQPISPRVWLTAAGVDVDAGTGPAPTLPLPEDVAAPGVAAPGPHAVQGSGTPLTPGPPAPVVAAPVAEAPVAEVPVGAPVELTAVPAQVAGYRDDQLVNAATIISVAQQMGLDAWTATVGVMTAMGESSLRNLDRGDTAGPDSRGLFQQRGNGAWGTYADRMTPATAARSFFTALLAVPGFHELPPTIAAHRTQRNADPQHYARHWPAAVQVVAALTADPTLVTRLADTTPPAVCTPAETDPAGDPGDLAGAQDVLAIAASLTGIPYRWGGSTPAAFDCSGYTQYVYAQAGITLPRNAAQQQDATTPVTTPTLGDLVFFGDPATHVGIYAGPSADGRPQMYDAPRTGAVTGLHDIWSDTATYGRAPMSAPGLGAQP